MPGTRKLLTNTVVQIVGRFLTLLISLVTLSYIANHLFVDGSALKGYGQYTVILTYISIIGATADLGLFTLVVREIIGKAPAEAGRIVGSALVFRFGLMLATLLLLAGVFHFLPYDLVVKQGIVLGAVIAFLILFSQAVSTIFQANLVSERIVISEVIGRLVIASLTIYFLHQGLGLIPVIVANLIGNLVLLIVSFILSRSSVPIKISFDFAHWRAVFPQFWSIALVTLLGLVHFRIDSLILSFDKSTVDVGIYGVAYRIFDIILVIPAILAANLLPALTHLNNNDRRSEMALLVERATGWLLAISTTIGVVIIFLAPWVIIFITQPDFLAASLPLRILTPAFIALFLTTLSAETVIALKGQKRLIGGYVLVVGLDIILNLILIPRYSYVGAATTTVISEIVLMFYTLSQLARLIPVKLGRLPLGRLICFVTGNGLFGLLIHQLIIPKVSQFELLGKVSQGAWLFGTVLMIIGGAAGLFWLIFQSEAKAISRNLVFKNDS